MNMTAGQPMTRVVVMPGESRIRIGIEVVPPKTDYVATLDVEKDEMEPAGPELYRRWVVGRIVERGPAWDVFLSKLGGKQDTMKDGHCYSAVPGIYADYLLHSDPTAAEVSGDTMRLVILERFSCSPEEYRISQAHRKARIERQIHELAGKHPSILLLVLGSILGRTKLVRVRIAGDRVQRRLAGGFVVAEAPIEDCESIEFGINAPYVRLRNGGRISLYGLSTQDLRQFAADFLGVRARLRNPRKGEPSPIT